MRQRRVKNLDERIEAAGEFQATDPRALKGHWHEEFGNQNPIFFEIGCGKGRFVTSMAEKEPWANFIGAEGQISVALRSLEKAIDAGKSNVRVFIDFVQDVGEYFEPGEIAGVYLNFSDPWPKPRHAKRRLTHRRRLANYMTVLPEGGFVAFKTDNEELFRFSMEEINEEGYEILEYSEDLAASEFAAENTMTEYEEKWTLRGRNIYYVKIAARPNLAR